jgi:hypothetical protein
VNNEPIGLQDVLGLQPIELSGGGVWWTVSGSYLEERIEDGIRTGYYQNIWRYRAFFHGDDDAVDYRKCTLFLNLRTRFVPDHGRIFGGGAHADVMTSLSLLMPEWRDAVHGAFNLFKLVSTDAPSGAICCSEIKVNLMFEPHSDFRWNSGGYINTVRVNRGDGESRVNQWFLGDTRFSQSPYKGAIHEVGHMLGLIDEYSATDVPGRYIPPDTMTSIMGRMGGAAEFFERHIDDLVRNKVKLQDNISWTPYRVERR